MTSIAYLVNQYPSPTHTFIKREMHALEERGMEIHRFAIRSTTASVHADDAEEAARTRVVLDGGAVLLAAAVLRLLVRDPGHLLAGTIAALRLGRASRRGRLIHLVYLAEACVLREWFAAASVTHVHAHFGTNPAAVALLCERVGGPGYSVTVHGPEEFYEAESLKLADKVASARFAVAISSFGRSQLMRWSAPEHWDRVHVVRCGVDDSYLRRAHEPVRDVPRLVTVGRLAPQKGHLLLIEAVARLLEEDVPVELDIIGDGEMRPEIDAAIAATGKPEAIRLLGWRSNEEVCEALAASRAFVLPSFAEGLPVVLMEALALGRPVVATAIAGIPELVQAGVNGWLVPPGSVESLADALRDVLATPVDTLDAMGRAGAQAVARDHDARCEASRLEALITTYS